MGAVSYQQHQRTAAHHLVKLVAMADQKLTVVGGGMHGLVLQFDAGKRLATETPEKFIVIARDVHHPGSRCGQPQQLVDNLSVAVWEMSPSLHGNQVDDVAYQVKCLALNVIQEIQQIVRLAIGGTQMDVGYEYASILSHGASGENRPAFRILTSPWQHPVTPG
jgi:hypothetical protein